MIVAPWKTDIRQNLSALVITDSGLQGASLGGNLKNARMMMAGNAKMIMQ